MVSYFNFHTGISLVAAGFHQVLVQPLQVAEVLVGVFLGAGNPSPDGIASLLVKVTLAVNAFQGIR